MVESREVEGIAFDRDPALISPERLPIGYVKVPQTDRLLHDIHPTGRGLKLHGTEAKLTSKRLKPRGHSIVLVDGQALTEGHRGAVAAGEANIMIPHLPDGSLELQGFLDPLVPQRRLTHERQQLLQRPGVSMRLVGKERLQVAPGVVELEGEVDEDSKLASKLLHGSDLGGRLSLQTPQQAGIELVRRLLPHSEPREHVQDVLVVSFHSTEVSLTAVVVHPPRHFYSVSVKEVARILQHQRRRAVPLARRLH
mmetsp:Transcript_15121/g.51023  ORF Transcript_15121/g.51023 Transcript_15121/m.51023 type:complete len:253 (-) Transcript_15121:179-937(-)